MASPRSQMSLAMMETPSGVYKEDPTPSKRSRVMELLLGIPGILMGATLGVLLGWIIQQSDPSDDLVSWVGIPGQLFIRAIKCLVTPLVFCSLIVGMADMLAMGKASTIGGRTAGLYAISTIVAASEGMLWVTLFRPLFGNKNREEETTSVEFAMGCGDKPGHFLQHHANGSITCAFDPLYAEKDQFSNASVFLVNDIKGSFKLANSGILKRTLTEALQGQLFAMVPENMTSAFAENVLLSVIMFSIVFGIALAMLPSDMNVVTNAFRELNLVFMKMIQWVIVLTPLAIISLLASSVAAQDDLGLLVSDVGVYVGCVLSVLCVHVFIFYPVFLRAFVRTNPYKWLMSMARAQVFALGCASSMATLPVTMSCMDATRTVSTTLSRFVLSLGATVGMDGAALGYPIAIVFMAEAAGLGDQVGTVEMFLIVLVSTIGAVGAGPVPSAGMVMTMTIWSSVFPHIPLPPSFAFIVATDWLVDRFQTAVNVTCDTVVCRIVADLVGETLDESDRMSLRSAMDSMVSHNRSLKDVLETSNVRVEEP